ncbi:hypothetical protein GCM10027445_40490 [Amycolatopsis endophytica]|uniref:Uncharacterized protein n=1 Tax=Amycolatopsis endophytica TaxID=860233 RepID=A0A853B6D7_9PSEU|nr:hypothetical protein [Amycolatopsis endophytica]NYI90808.1 hypothetical protein [Amycolatopsis endophytica]
MTERRWRSTLGVLGVAHLVLAAWAAVSPRSFHAVLADFGPYDAHLVRDFAACAATFGTGLVIAAGRPAWRTPVLVTTALWTGLHALSHVADIANSDPALVGPLEAAALVVLTVVLVALARLSARAGSHPPQPPAHQVPGE